MFYCVLYFTCDRSLSPLKRLCMLRIVLLFLRRRTVVGTASSGRSAVVCRDADRVCRQRTVVGDVCGHRVDRPLSATTQTARRQ